MEQDKLSRLLPDGVDPRDADELDATWQMLGSIESPAPDSERMRARIDAVIDAIGHAPGFTRTTEGRLHPTRGYVLQGLATAAMLVIGIGIGWFARSGGFASGASRPASNDATAQIAAMRAEMRDLREMVSLSLMQQQSASERLKGVTWTGQLDRPSSEVVTALLDALMHDPNVNVRLATIDALERFASQEEVRRGAILAVQQLGVSDAILTTAFFIFFGATCLTMALAVGLGSREWAGKIAESTWKQEQEQARALTEASQLGTQVFPSSTNGRTRRTSRSGKLAA